MTESWAQRCEAFVRREMATDAAHDLGHIRRVVAMAERICAAEGADAEIVTLAAWLHDCVSVSKDNPDRKRASVLAGEKASEWLGAEGFPADRIGAVRHAIEAHSFSAGIAPETLEAKVAQDADRLDAIGAIGVARCFATAGAMGSSLFDPEDPFAENRPLDDKRFAVDHFTVKLFKLPEMLNTDAARTEAERRVAVMRRFLADLATEVSA